MPGKGSRVRTRSVQRQRPEKKIKKHNRVSNIGFARPVVEAQGSCDTFEKQNVTVVHEGYLWKKETLSRWNRRYFAKNSSDNLEQQKGSRRYFVLFCRNIVDRTLDKVEKVKMLNTVKQYDEGQVLTLVYEDDKEKNYLAASEKEMMRWVRAGRHMKNDI